MTFYAPRLQKIPYPTIKGIKFILDTMAESAAAGKERGAGEFCRSFAASRTRPERVFQAALEKLIALEFCRSRRTTGSGYEKAFGDFARHLFSSRPQSMQ